MFARWAEDPEAFVLEVFGPGYEADIGKPLELDRWQRRGLRSLVQHEPGECGDATCSGQAHQRIAFRACKGPGKSAEEAWIGWWRLSCWRYSKGIAVSITGDNLKTNLWAELARWQRYSPLLMRLFEHKAEVIESRDHKTWKLEARAFPQDADKSKQAETLAGLHGPGVFVLLDEVGSFPIGVLSAAHAIFNVKEDNALLVASGNATSMDGALYHICTVEAARWHVIVITGDPDDPDRSPRIDIDEARAQIAMYTRADHVVMVNILSQFPPRGSNKLLGPDDITAAEKRAIPRGAHEGQPWVWGIDVAAEGDDACKLYKRQGPIAMPPRTWRGLPTDHFVLAIIQEFHDAVRARRAPKRIFIDKGGLGRGPYDTLRTALGDIVVGVDFGESALDDTQYADRRTEMYCLAAKWIREVGSIPVVPELRRDLTKPTIGVVAHTSKGTRRKLQSKKDMGKPSPDDSDGLALTFAEPVLSDVIERRLGMSSSPMPSDFDPFKHMEGGA
jgi:phage terminase large subunit